MIKKIFGKRTVSMLLAVLMVIGLVPFSVNTAIASSVLGGTNTDRVSDPSTMDDWTNYFGPSVMSTVNAGSIWTDKSVFTDASAFPGISLNNSEGFLVALSAIASNLTVEGMSYVPTDTMLILDVSGSMNTNGLSDEMVEAANASIDKLLTDNKYNRIGVALYSGATSGNNNDASEIILPLGRYTTSDPGVYLNHSSSGSKRISVSSSVRNENGNKVSGSKNVTGATYIQKGVLSAVEEFADQAGNTVVSDPVLGELHRIPVMVLMSDGAPTLGDTDFTNPGTHDLGNGSSNYSYVGFVTQLTLAYAKEQIKAAYGKDALFYTLGLGVGSNDIATSVLNPSSSSTAINSFWDSYNALSTGETLTVHSTTYWENTGTNRYPEWEEVTVNYNVTKTSTVINQNYVDDYFLVDTDSTTPGDDLIKAFEEIVSKIELQSSYYPTLVETTEHLSGYVTFVDKLGKYMDVTDIKGLHFNGSLHTGSSFASHFDANSSDLGTATAPTALGQEFFNSVRDRLGISADQARTLISLAYQHGQISYNSSTGEFSNYIGWYANAAGDFLGFWHEGITTMPDPADPSLTDATRPVYINRSYGFLGETDESHGVRESDMMYATIRVQTEIATGDQTVAFAIPAALIPTVTYNVSLDEHDELVGLTVTGATAPIRLIYETSLDSEINEITVKSLATDPEYVANHINADGDYEFFTNMWNHDLSIEYGTNNAYSYFRPSTQNDKYYYTNDSLIYTDTNGTLYESNTAPSVSGTYYRGTKVYALEGGAYKTTMAYEKISEISLGKAQKTLGEQTWYIPAGTVHTLVEEFYITKTSNETDTISYSYAPFVDAQYNYYVGATHGNNGRITLTPATGIKIEKTVDELNTNAGADTAFVFTVTNKTNTADNNTYKSYHVDADKKVTESTVTFADGKATVSLKAGEKIYLSGMAANDIFNVAETETLYYKIASVNGNTSAKDADLVIVDKSISSASFVNTARGTGNLTVAKSVSHDLGADHAIPDTKAFTFKVTLSGLNLSGKNFEAKHSADASVTSVTVGNDGTFTVTLKNNEEFTVYGLPEGTTATVVEENPGAGFTPAYFENDVAGDGTVDIVKDNVVSVIVRNAYAPEKVYPVNISVGGTKTLSGRDWRADDEFTFTLQKFNPDTNTWTNIATDTVKGTDSQKTFSFDDAFANAAYDKAGSYYYRITEADTGITGIKYDHTVHAFLVVVADKDMDGKLEIDEVRPERETVHVSFDGSMWKVNADFTNVYNVSEISASIDITKLVTNASGSTLAHLAGFTFELYEGTTLVATSLPTTDRGFTRLNLNFNDTHVGTHTYTLKEVVPANVPAGWTYSAAEIKITATVTLDSVAGQLHAVLNVGDSTANTTNSVAVEFTNVYDPADASLELDVRKVLNGRPLKAGEFTFEIRLTDGTVVATGTNDAAGKVTFNKALTFDKIGTFHYVVAETSADGKGVTTDKSVRRVAVTVVDNGGTLSASYVVENIAEKHIVFTNTYTASDLEHVIGGKKILEGRELLNDEFTFTLAPSDENGNVSAGAAILSAKNFADGSFKFDAIKFTAPGTYFYLVSEVQDNIALGVKYDTTKYLIKIVVKDNLEGALVIESEEIHVIGNGVATEIVFRNVYVPAPVDGNIAGNKTYQSNIGGTLTDKSFAAGTFTFRLYNSDSTWAEGSLIEAVTNTADAKFAFSTLTFDKAGVYYYLVKELHGGDIINGIAYDSTVYRVKITVTDNGLGNLVAVTNIYDGANVTKESIAFSNYYIFTDSDKVVIAGNKVLTGLALEAGKFNFELYSSDATGTAGTLIETVTNAADGSFSFSELSYENVGTSYYLVKEKNGGSTIEGIKYDAKTYLITVTVTDNGMGKLVASVSGAESIVFTNVYTASSVDYTVNGNKELSGRPLLADEFSFTISDSDANGTAGTLLETVKNAADGSFSFSALTFDKAGTYYYLIAENGGSIAGVKYDTTKYLIKIVVTDDLKGALVITSTELHVLGNGIASEIVFRNVYSPASTDADISGNKKYQSSIGGTLTDKSFAAGTFTFMLYSSDSAWAEGSLIETVTNAADGTFSFSVLSFNKAGEYFYLVRELHGGRTINGIIYDSAEYRVKITVTDDLNGSLVATVAYYDATNTPASQIGFNNLYTVNDSGKVTIVGDKVLVGKTLEAGKFSFELYSSDATGTAGTLIETVTNAANGEFSFSDLSFSTVGEYYYLVKEKNGGATIDGITYDSATYLIKVTVTDNGLGQLIETVDGADSIVFTNVYTTSSASATIGGEKEYNKTLTDGMFSFNLVDNTTGSIIETVKNVGNKFNFSVLNYTSVGTYTYTVSEVIGFAGGVTYDTAKYTVTVTVTDNGLGQLIATVTGADNIKFVNSYATTDTEAVIGGTKVLNGRPLAAGEFSFVLKDSSNNVIETVKNAANGSFVFSAISYNTPGTYTYTVSEVKGSLGGITYDDKVYTVTVTVTDNGEGKLVTTVSGADSITFTNTYTTSDASVTFKGHKELLGRPLAADEFSFVLKDSSNNVIETVKNAADGSFSFSEIKFTKAGTYTYTVSEVKGSLGGITYDTTVYTVTVTVTDNGEGKLIAATSISENSLLFTNTYNTTSASATIGGEKEYNKTLTDGMFSFNLVDNATGSIIETVKNAGNKFSFSALNYTAVGTYTYTVSEVIGFAGGVTYDTAKYTVTVTVTDNGLGQLIATVTGADNIKFVNSYATTDTEAVIGGTKVLNGRPLAAGEFSFVLKDSSNNVIETVKNAANGSFVFSAISYNTPGTYTYTVSEVKGSLGGITYDDKVYTVTVTVTDNGEGKLVTTVSGADSITFTNTYTTSDASVTFKGHKELLGRPLAADEFSFVLKDSSNNVIETVKNAADGSFSFSEIKFTKAGTYTYTVNEVKGSLGGVSYDAKVYHITVTVTDNGEGKLVATVTGANAISFSNTYTSASAKAGFAGTKILTGRKLSAGEFSFELKDASGKVLETVKNAADGTFTFSEIEFTKAGTYTFTVNEVKGSLGGITYDNNVYTVTVTVTDNGEGKLVATASGASNIVFNNIYSTSSCSLALTATKIMNGRALADGEFSFILRDASGKDIATAKNTADGKIIFAPITYTAIGTYTYTVSEIAGNLPGVSYDKGVYTVTVTVADNGMGQLVATAQGASAIIFTNNYAAASDSISFKGLKFLSGRALEAGEFSFVLKDASGKAIETVKNAADGTFSFSEISYTRAGIYKYTVSEVRGDLGGVSYDTTVYNITVTVTDNGQGKLETAISGADSIVFRNTYKAATIVLNFFGKKIMVGRDLEAGEFSFILKDQYGDVIGTATNDKNGDFIFGDLEFTEEGQFFYYVSELIGNETNVTYDDSVYAIRVEITDDGSGQLRANVGGAHDITFTNYFAAPTELTLSGSKVLSGRELLDGEFSFVLKDENGNVIETVKNAADGSFAFSAIEYTEEGTYKYTVNELLGTVGGVLYDERVYEITVTVTNNGEGQLVATVTGDSDITFTNSYVASDAHVRLDGIKELIGRELGAGEFSFVLTDENGMIIETVLNKADGSFAFGDLIFSEAGTYTYTVSEIIPGETNGITYDTTVYTVTVTVTDNGEGRLVATVSGADSIKFTNIYTATSANVEFGGNKNLSGRELGAGEFSFELKDANGSVIETVTNAADGTFTFSSIEFKAEGTYTFTVNEVVGNDTLVTYDATVYTVTITVTDNGKGALFATVSGASSIVFNNVYTTEETTYPTPPPVDPESPDTGDSASVSVWLGASIIAVITASVHILGKRREVETE